MRAGHNSDDLAIIDGIKVVNGDSFESAMNAL